MHVVVIGDIVGSRAVSDRKALQRQLAAAVSHVNARLAAASALLSPYTITLGDEIQAVYSHPASVILDVISIQGEMLPHRMRFCIGLGAITTRINKAAAIGMDGPAFHSSRAGIDELKRTGDNFLAVKAEEGVEVDLEDCAARLLDARVRAWRANRFKVFMADVQCAHGESVRRPDAQKVAARIGISATAVYKNRAEGQIELVTRASTSIGRSLSNKVSQRPRPRGNYRLAHMFSLSPSLSLALWRSWTIGAAQPFAYGSCWLSRSCCQRRFFSWMFRWRSLLYALFPRFSCYSSRSAGEKSRIRWRLLLLPTRSSRLFSCRRTSVRVSRIFG